MGRISDGMLTDLNIAQKRWLYGVGESCRLKSATRGWDVGDFGALVLSGWAEEQRVFGEARRKDMHVQLAFLEGADL